MCRCMQTVGIGLPFDHPIWEGLARQAEQCPIHGRRSQTAGWDGIQWTWPSQPIKRGRHERVSE